MILVLACCAVVRSRQLRVLRIARFGRRACCRAMMVVIMMLFHVVLTLSIPGLRSL